MDVYLHTPKYELRVFEHQFFLFEFSVIQWVNIISGTVLAFSIQRWII